MFPKDARILNDCISLLKNGTEKANIFHESPYVPTNVQCGQHEQYLGVLS